GPPLERGIVTIEGDRIAAVDPCGTRRVDVDAGNAALLPGFVNAHTHLDLSGLRGQIPPSGRFTDWLKAITSHRLNVVPAVPETAIRAGLRECLRTGTTLVGDISAQGSSWSILAAAPLRAVVFYEGLGLTEDRAQQAADAASDWLARHPA